MSNLQITEQMKRVTVLTFTDRLDAFNAPDARQQITDQMDAGAVNFVVDISQVTFMDSAGIAVLVNLLKKVTQVNGGMKLVRPVHDSAMRLLRMTKFDQVFKMFDTADEAVNAF